MAVVVAADDQRLRGSTQHASVATGLIKAFQWNPHYQCFGAEQATCQTDAVSALNEQLASGIDFANIVELEAQGYTPPDAWQSRTHKCGIDLTTLMWDSGKWTSVGSGNEGCAGTGQYVVQALKQQDFTVVVVGAHLQHPDGSPLETQLKNMADSIAQVMESANSQNVIIISDTNQEASVSNDDILIALKLPNYNTRQATDLFDSCCAKTPDGFIHEYDRIITNFGTSMATEKVFDPPPSWVGTEFHTAVLGSLSY